MDEKTPLLQFLPVALLSLFWSTVVMFRFLWGILINGPTKTFRRVNRDVRPDLLDDPSLGTHGFARLKTLKLHYVAKGSESKPLMLMVHGFPEFWYSWRHQLKEFGGDYRAVAMDMRGYSESDKPRKIADYQMDRLIGDIKGLIEVLGYEKCVLLAHDWGGAVAWAFTQMHPDMVDKLIICNCPHSKAFQKMIRSDRKQFLMSWYMMFFQMPWLPEMMLSAGDFKMLDQMYRGKATGVYNPGTMTSEDMEMYKFTFGQQDGFKGPVNYYRAAFQYKRSLTYPKEKIQVPTLMIWGKKDAALSEKLPEASGDYVEDYRVKYIEDASHWVQQDKPEEVNRLIREFLEE